MRRLLPGAVLAALLFLSVAAAHAADPARITAEKRVKPRVVELTISTPAFTTPTKVDIDLPTGYDAEPDRRWPVTYFLAGTMNTYATFNSLIDGVGLTKAYPSILVSPNGDSGYWSDWYNDGAFGPPMYETYVIDQLIPLIDAHFRTIPTRSQRVVFGASMGGYGAMMVAARHPDLFSAAATISGAVDSNLPANGAVLSASPTFQNAPADAIYGPRATQEVRWHGHNPTDLADNLRGMDLQVRSANGTLNTAIGEKPASADSASCVVEAGVYMASIDFNDALNALRIPHLWRDYGPGCHTPPNFTRETADTLAAFTKVFAHPPAAPASFDYKSIEPDFDIWGWHVHADPRRALEFLQLKDVSATSMTLVGSGTTTVTTPPSFRGLRRVDVGDTAATPDGQGRVRFTVDLGPPDADQQDTPGATTSQTSRTVTLKPYARAEVSHVRATRTRIRVCARALGGTVAARISVAGARGAKVTLGSKTTCRTLRWTRRRAGRHATVRLTGKDRFGHAVSGRRTVRLPR